MVEVEVVEVEELGKEDKVAGDRALSVAGMLSLFGICWGICVDIWLLVLRLLSSAALRLARAVTVGPDVVLCAAERAPTIGLVSEFLSVREFWEARLRLLLLLNIIELFWLELLLLLLLLWPLLLLDIVDLHWYVYICWHVVVLLLSLLSSIGDRGWIPVILKAIVVACLAVETVAVAVVCVDVAVSVVVVWDSFGLVGCEVEIV